MAPQISGIIDHLGGNSIFMLESIPVTIVISTFLAFLAAIGVGGGSLLMLWLTLILGYPHWQARLVNLLFFLPCALISSLFRWKQGELDIKRVLPAVCVGCIAAAAGSYCSFIFDVSLLQKLFGGLLIITGLRELFYKQKKRR